jgi:hypothetical protein
VIYLQGLPTAMSRDPEGDSPGWQIAPGGHEFPQDALSLVVEFFKRDSRK